MQHSGGAGKTWPDERVYSALGMKTAPSSLTALVQAAAVRPSFIGRPVMVTLVPGFRSPARMPLLARHTGVVFLSLVVVSLRIDAQ
jgi:hypothetical protein